MKTTITTKPTYILTMEFTQEELDQLCMSLPLADGKLKPIVIEFNNAIVNANPCERPHAR